MATKYGFTPALKELRFLFCQTSDHSAATRAFLTRAYPTMKRHNPATPILLREAHGTPPTVYARFARGEETRQSLQGLSNKQIEDAVAGLVQHKESSSSSSSSSSA